MRFVFTTRAYNPVFSASQIVQIVDDGIGPFCARDDDRRCPTRTAIVVEFSLSLTLSVRPARLALLLIGMRARARDNDKVDLNGACFSVVTRVTHNINIKYRTGRGDRVRAETD